MVNIITIIYTIFLITSFYYGGFLIGISVLIFEAITLSFIPIIIKNKKESLKKIVAAENNTKPILNVNKDPWYYLVELPDINQLEAKKIVHLRRKYGKYNSLEDFFIKNMIDIGKRERIQKFIKL